MFHWDQLFLVGWAGWVFLCSIEDLKPFSVGLVETVEKVLAYVIMLHEELLCFNRKWLEKCSFEKHQPYRSQNNCS